MKHAEQGRRQPGMGWRDADSTGWGVVAVVWYAVVWCAVGRDSVVRCGAVAVVWRGVAWRGVT